MGDTKTDSDLIKFILDEITWSFSSVSCYDRCPRAFKMTYLDRLSKFSNAMAEWGTLGHHLLEMYYSGEKDFYELSQIYEDEYRTKVKSNFPPNPRVDLAKSYYDAGKRYFDNFQGDFDDCEILGVEEKIRISIGKYKFIGFIDLVLRDKSDGRIIICDHKSKSKFKSKAEKREYLRQLYLYAIYIYNKYGEWPKQLMYNMFRVGKFEYEDFDADELKNVKQWFTNTIDRIYEDVVWEATGAKGKDRFWCNWICSVSHHCNYSDRYEGR